MSVDTLWLRSTTTNQFFGVIQQMLAKFLNQCVHNVKNQDNKMLELVQARDEILATAYLMMQAQIQVLLQRQYLC